MGKTVMRPRMKRGISIAAAVACSFTLIPAVNAVQGDTLPVASAQISSTKESLVVKNLENKNSIFDNPATLKKLQEMQTAQIESSPSAKNTSPTDAALRDLYSENGTPLPQGDSDSDHNFVSGYTLLAAHASSSSEMIRENDGLGKGSNYVNSNGSATNETSVGIPRVYARAAGEKEFTRQQNVSSFNPEGNPFIIDRISVMQGSTQTNTSNGRPRYSEARVNYRFRAPADFNGEVVIYIPSGGYGGTNNRVTERLFVVTSDSNPYSPDVTDNNSNVTPEGKDLTTTIGNLPDAKEGIGNAGDLPNGTEYEWVKEPDVSKPGTSTGTIKVTTPDGNETEVEVEVTVTDPDGGQQTDADKYDPQANPLTTPVGEVPAAAADGIKNKDSLPTDTEYDWQTPPDVSTPGESTGVVKVTYPDGSSETVNVPVTVTDSSTDADKNPAVGQDITTKVNVEPNAEDGIENLDELPEGTTATWEKQPDVSKPGDTTGTVMVTYPDKSTQSVPVKVHVTGDADEYTPEPQQITVPSGETPKAEDGIANKDDLPDGTDYTWKTTPDTSKPGDTTGTVVVTYPDGSKEEVEVPINVTSDADNYDPKPQDVNTGVGVNPPASDGIANKDELPEGTEYEWVEQPDVSTPGETSGTVKVAYPDGSSETVDVRVMVTQDIYISDIAKQANGDYKVTRNDGKTWTIDLHSLNDRISNNEKRIDDLEKGAKDNKDAIDALRKETDDLKKQVDGLENSAQDADKRLEELEKQAKEQGETLENLVKDNTGAADAMKNLTQQVNDLQKQQEVLNTRITNLESRVTVLEATVKGLQSNAHAWAQCFSGIGTSAIPVLLALPLGLAAQADVPGIGNINTEVQKKLGIFNPAAAKWVSENRGIMQMAAGVMGFAGILGAMVHAAQDCGPYAKDDYVKDTDLGKLSSKMGSIKDGNTEGSSIEGGSSLGEGSSEK